MIELEHSPLGGSAAHRFMTCAYSFLKHREQLQDGTFENIESDFASLGTAAHEIAAKAIVEKREPFEYISEAFNGYRVGWPGEIKLDAVHVYFNECMNLIESHKHSSNILIEQTIKLPEIHPLFKGTVDFGMWVEGEGLWLRDYKNGEGIGVDAVNNPQLLYYAALLIMSSEELQQMPKSFPVNLGIVQPNFYGIYEDIIPWETTLGHVLDWFNAELLPTMNNLSTRESYTEEDAVSGEHCQFCPVLLECPKMQKAFKEYADASEDFVAMLTNEELDHYYSQREDARRFMKVLETTIHARLMTGSKIPSAKLVEKQTFRVWKPGGVAAIEATFGERAYKPREALSPAGVEKLSSRGKELALEYGYKPESAGLVVAPLSDRRPEAKAKGNAGVFAEHAARAMEDF